MSPGGNPVISYNDYSNDDLKVAACSNSTCSASTVTTVDSTGDVGSYTSIAIGANGNPVISYYDYSNGDLKVAACSNSTCSASTVTTVDSTGDVGSNTSIAIGADGWPIIVYRNSSGALRIAECESSTCANRRTFLLDSRSDWYGLDTPSTAMAITADGSRAIFYYYKMPVQVRGGYLAVLPAP
jgi:hypothetical protein